MVAGAYHVGHSGHTNLFDCRRHSFIYDCFVRDRYWRVVLYEEFDVSLLCRSEILLLRSTRSSQITASKLNSGLVWWFFCFFGAWWLWCGLLLNCVVVWKVYLANWLLIQLIDCAGWTYNWHEAICARTVSSRKERVYMHIIIFFILKIRRIFLLKLFSVWTFSWPIMMVMMVMMMMMMVMVMVNTFWQTMKLPVLFCKFWHLHSFTAGLKLICSFPLHIAAMHRTAFVNSWTIFRIIQWISEFTAHVCTHLTDSIVILTV